MAERLGSNTTTVTSNPPPTTTTTATAATSNKKKKKSEPGQGAPGGPATRIERAATRGCRCRRAAGKYQGKYLMKYGGWTDG